MERVNLQVIEMERVMQKMSARTKVELDQGKLNLNQSLIKIFNSEELLTFFIQIMCLWLWDMLYL